MFENYKQMSADDQAQVKSIHKTIRAISPARYRNLAWGWVRGFHYRRIERTTRTQIDVDGTIVQCNAPDARLLTHLLGEFIPGFAEIGKRWWETKSHPAIEAWLKNPDGAIPAPIRVKKPYVPSVTSSG